MAKKVEGTSKSRDFVQGTILTITLVSAMLVSVPEVGMSAGNDGGRMQVIVNCAGATGPDRQQSFFSFMHTKRMNMGRVLTDLIYYIYF